MQVLPDEAKDVKKFHRKVFEWINPLIPGGNKKVTHT